MIIKFNTYNLIQEKSSFSDLLPNDFIRYIYERYNVSKNKFSYNEIPQNELFHYLTTILICDDVIFLISNKGKNESMILYYYKDNEHTDKIAGSRASNDTIQKVWIKDNIGKCYKLDIIIDGKNKDEQRDKNYKYTDTYLADRVLENLKKILPIFRKKSISELKNDIIKYANEIDDDILISKHLNVLTADLKKITKFNLESFLQEVDNYKVGNTIRTILDYCYDLKIYDKNFFKILNPIEDKIITQATNSFIKNYISLEINKIKTIDNIIENNPERYIKYIICIKENPDLYKKYGHLLDANNFDLI